MRLCSLFLLLSIAALTHAAELEQITTTDGRRLIGYYDAGSQTLTIEGPPKASFRLPATQIADRAPYVRPVPTDPVERDRQELVRLEASHAAAVAEVQRLRAIAATRSGRDVEVATAQADTRSAEAAAIARKIEEVRALLAAAAPPKPEPTAKPTATATPAATAEAALLRSLGQAQGLRDEAAELEFHAFFAWLEAQDLRTLPVPELGPDPRTSEIEARGLAMKQNQRREHWAKFLAKCRAATKAADRQRLAREMMTEWNSMQREDQERR